MRVKLARFEADPLVHTVQDDVKADMLTRNKFDDLKHIFWVRHSDLLEIVPRYPHLAGMDLKCTPIGLKPSWPPEGQHDDTPLSSHSASSPVLGNGLRGSLPNGQVDLHAKLPNGLH